MNSNMIVKLALSSAVVAIPTAGCTSLGLPSPKAMTSVDKLAKKAETNNRKAEKQLTKGRLDKAQKYAELAVEGGMTNATYRATLAKVYMAQGKFASAEQTLEDVMQLGVKDPRTVISLALARISQGRTGSAVALIEANRSIVSDSDYGLALALAGRDDQAVDVLTRAIRANGAGARVRQNLALAYAMNGRWREARIMASQDLAQTQVNEQITEWAHYARPGAYQRRVAGLLNVTPQADAGQPVRLALANANRALASAEAAPAQAAAPSFAIPAPASALADSGELAATGPAPISTSVGFAAAEEDVKVAAKPAPKPAMEAPLIAAVKGPIKTAMATGQAEPVKAATNLVPFSAPAAKAPVKLAIANVKPKRARALSGTHIVQLGAFSSTANAKKAWAKYSSSYSVLSGFSSASSSVTVGGKRLVRLAAMGFGNKSSAKAACDSIKAQGGSCIVRSIGAEKPVRLALR